MWGGGSYAERHNIRALHCVTYELFTKENKIGVNMTPSALIGLNNE